MSRRRFFQEERTACAKILRRMLEEYHEGSIAGVQDVRGRVRSEKSGGHMGSGLRGLGKDWALLSAT